MSNAEEKAYRERFEKELEEKLNIIELKKIRKLLEEINIHNSDEHKIFTSNFITLFGRTTDYKERLERQEKRNLWDITIDYIKERPALIFGSITALVSLNNIEYIYKIIELIIK
jgi:hypothetical protein